MAERIYDFAGIGIGPFNLSLACLTAPIKGLDGIFLDKNSGFDWHPGMLLEDSKLQTPFLSDLVTLADPTSPYSFLNYLKQQGRIYSFYIRESFFLLREEYNQYCQWAVSHLKNLVFNTEVTNIRFDENLNCYVIEASCTNKGDSKSYLAKKLVLGTGPMPYIPSCCKPVMEKTIHSSDYLFVKPKIQKEKSITIVGGGQSAAEIFYDLLQDVDNYDYELNWITRSPRYFPLEYTKLTLEMTSPEYMDYFYQLPEHIRDNLNKEQKQLSKGINSELINVIFDLLYAKRLRNEVNVNLCTNSDLVKTYPVQGGTDIGLLFLQLEQQQNYTINTRWLVLATGYSYQVPAYVKGISSRIRWDSKGRFGVGRYYSIDHADKDIYVQNSEFHTHGFVTPDLGIACYRNACIIRGLTGAEYYPIERRIAFQEFSAPKENITSLKVRSA